MRLLIDVWKDTFRLLNHRPKIFIPFIVVGVTNIIAAYILYYAPQRPLSIVLAPPIRRFFGERFLHYPFNFYILPQLYSYAEILVTAFVGIFMTALAVGMISDCMAGHQASFLISFIRAGKRYLTLIVVWVLIFTASFYTSKFIPKLFGTQEQMGYVLYTLIHFLSSVVVQLLFVYLVPFLIIKNKSIVVAIRDNFYLVARLLIPTILVGLMPAVLYVPAVILKAKTPALIEAFFPEIIIGIVVASIVAAVIVDALLTTSITVLFLKRQK